ncbi:hypothetical protein AB6834_02595 [Carnobacterium divergens]|uniref:hypothetical protein n=1 Tax=Carnobacterium divergens TaxID=2748 RepID=UPI00288F7248|nr:hypothetical protein [Carnobacterium divergens]MDT2011201.1 hypothetical protein [Carnobacterium divergens]
MKLKIMTSFCMYALEDKVNCFSRCFDVQSINVIKDRKMFIASICYRDNNCGHRGE